VDYSHELEVANKASEALQELNALGLDNELLDEDGLASLYGYGNLEAALDFIKTSVLKPLCFSRESLSMRKLLAN